ncbi:hypothetical protein M422DRAFT_72098 [Sphaerobolus stellatus SS14]|uniref:Aminoglycoside phosphotransferase domain-containing protein n=1 Tax=Sphaerobolus stellatus (strain SS14) TaxID=990650 RepID=A0A0C9UK25_SPHS4|nr:hypothetical protein M422DRAFT_72098 [Sphaerobolus stellatus SS14]
MQHVPFTDDEIRVQCRNHLAQRTPGVDDDRANFVVLQPETSNGSFAVKIASDFDKPGLRYELAFMTFLNKLPRSNRYKVPRGYGIVKDDNRDYLVMEYLEGPTMWEVMKYGAADLPERDANDIAAALQELRNNSKCRQDLLDSNRLTPLGHWHPQSYIFSPDRDGGRSVANLEDFKDFMTVRFEKAGVDMAIVPLSGWVLTHDDLSPHNFKRCADNRIGILDLRTTFLAPFWWEFYGLHQSRETEKWIIPLKKAMHRYEMAAPEPVVQELDDKWMDWFVKQGPSYGRMERKLGKGKFESPIPT